MNVIIFLFLISTNDLNGIWLPPESIEELAHTDEIVISLPGINSIVLQVVRNGYSSYPSSYLPSENDLYYDALDLAIGNLKRDNFKCYLWINTFLIWSSPLLPQDSFHLVFKHPEWLFIEQDSLKDGYVPIEYLNEELGIEGIYLNPEIPSVRKYIKSYISELASRYNVDGFILDFVRYPNKHYPRSNIFYKVSPDISTFSYYPNKANQLAMQWLSYQYLIENKQRILTIENFIDEINDTLKIINPDIELGITSFPDITGTALHLGQNWLRWNCDFICFFTDSTKTDSIPEIDDKKLVLTTIYDNEFTIENRYNGYIYFISSIDEIARLGHRTLISIPHFFQNDQTPTLPDLFSINFPLGIYNFNDLIQDQILEIEPYFIDIIDSLSYEKFFHEESILFVGIYREDSDTLKISEAFRFLSEDIEPGIVCYMFNSDSSPYPPDTTWKSINLHDDFPPFLFNDITPVSFISDDGKVGFYIYEVDFIDNFKYFNTMNDKEKKAVILNFLFHSSGDSVQ